MRRLTIILEIILLFVLPVLWFLLGLGSDSIRLYVFEIFVVLFLILAISRKMNFRAMGFRLDNFLESAWLLLPGTVLAVAITFIFYKLHIGTKYYFGYWWRNDFFLYYFLLGAFSQEFGFRGYLLMRLKELFRNPLPIIFVNALLFAWIHILHHSLFIFVEAFVFGAYLTWVYLKKPNIIAATLAHGLVGAAVIILGFM